MTNWYVFLFKDKLANWLDRDIAVSTKVKVGKSQKLSQFSLKIAFKNLKVSTRGNRDKGLTVHTS